ncbi:MAG: alpha/beta fold hydrolase [Rhodothermales bacterium]|nr:alpha/beta fold hydrolase [Rhodothermales bacterium]MBO6780870.1 alpha/beta fold hydrolase [Rhodothermales bacterium]
MKKIGKLLGLGLLAGLLVLLVLIAIPVDPTIPGMASRDGGAFWDMDGGYRIAHVHVKAQGSASGAPIVVLHGGPGGYIHSSYTETFGRLSQLGRDVFLYDQVGSGLSDRLPNPKDYTFLGHAADLVEIVEEHIAQGPVVLVGQSYGGKLASYFMATHPGLVESAILVSPGGIEPPLFDESGAWVNEVRYPVPDSLVFRPPRERVAEMGLSAWPVRAIASVALATTFNVKLMPDTEADGVLNSIATRITRNMVCDPEAVQPEEGGGGFYSHGWSNWYGGVDDWRQPLSESPVPLLVVQGACDYLPFSATYEHAALAPLGRYVFVTDAGHVIWWEQPAVLVETLSRFIDGEQTSTP